MKYLPMPVGLWLIAMMVSCESENFSGNNTASQSWLEGTYFGLSHPKGSRVISMIFDKDGIVKITERSDVIDASMISPGCYEGTYTLSGDKVHLKYEVKYKDGSSAFFEDVWERKSDSGLEFLVLPRLNSSYASCDEINQYGIVVRAKEMDTKEFVSAIH